MPDSFKKKKTIREMLKSPNFFENLLDYDGESEVNRNLDEENIGGENEDRIDNKEDMYVSNFRTNY